MNEVISLGSKTTTGGSVVSGSSNVLIMPSQHSAAISYKMIKSMSRAKVIGPLLIGLGLPIEIAPLRSSTSEIIPTSERERSLTDRSLNK